MIRVKSIDHLVLTVDDVEASAQFYAGVLGMRRVEFGNGRLALHFGRQKLNLHSTRGDIQPRAACPGAGAMDLCLVLETPMSEVIEHLEQCGVPVEVGPVERTGARGPIRSVYIRDLDGNLIELSEYTGE